MTQLYEAARQFVGASWVHRGRLRAELDSDGLVISPAELDCVGLAVVAAQDLGWSVEDILNYPRHTSGVRLESQVEKNMGPPVMVRGASLDNLQPNDVVTLRYGKHGRMRHVGVIGAHPEGGLSIIHADGNIGRVVEQRIDANTIPLIANVYRRAA